jgi:hypothetical protein
MLNAQYFGAGMNLQMTTDLVIYHRFSNEMEEQIIGRAQRLGRKTPLNVYYLLHNNESANINDKFKFIDCNTDNYLEWIKNDNIEIKNNKVNNNEEINESLVTNKKTTKKIKIVDDVPNINNFEIIQ